MVILHDVGLAKTHLHLLVNMISLCLKTCTHGTHCSLVDRASLCDTLSLLESVFPSPEGQQDEA
jgi:hypothetical protein